MRNKLNLVKIFLIPLVMVQFHFVFADIFIDDKTKDGLRQFGLSLNLNSISKVESYSPGFDFQGFNFYKGDDLFLNLRVIVDYPDFPSKEVPEYAEKMCLDNDNCNCVKWQSDKQSYSGECLIKYNYIKEYDLTLYAHGNFSDLSLKNRTTAMNLLRSIKSYNQSKAE